MLMTERKQRCGPDDGELIQGVRSCQAAQPPWSLKTPHAPLPFARRTAANDCCPAPAGLPRCPASRSARSDATAHTPILAHTARRSARSVLIRADVRGEVGFRSLSGHLG